MNRYRLHEPRPFHNFGLYIGRQVKFSDMYFQKYQENRLLNVRGTVIAEVSDGDDMVEVQWINPAKINRSLYDVAVYEKIAKFSLEYIESI